MIYVMIKISIVVRRTLASWKLTLSVTPFSFGGVTPKPRHNKENKGFEGRKVPATLITRRGVTSQVRE